MTSYPKIFRAMQDSDEARSVFRGELKRRGVSVEAWHRRETREAVCEAIRGVRRALEAELWS
jgi:hypothetical protein